jgi:hypothetical protein
LLRHFNLIAAALLKITAFVHPQAQLRHRIKFIGFFGPFGSACLSD